MRLSTLQNALMLFTLFISSSAIANTADLTELYKKVSAERQAQAKTNIAREQAFLAEKNTQAEKLAALKEEYAAKKAALDKLQAEVRQNSQTIADLDHQLTERTHGLKDLFSAWRQVASDTLTNRQNSLISSEHPASVMQLKKLLAQKTLPDTQDMTQLNQILQQDIQQTGAIKIYQGMLALPDGRQESATIQRIGPFTATSEGNFLQYDNQQQMLSIASRQPIGLHQNTVQAPTYQQMSPGKLVTASIDPSRGVVLERLALTPTWQERLQQGGYIGYAIIILGGLGLALAFLRWLNLTMTRAKIHKQMKNPNKIDTRNPLGKILAAYQHSQNQPSTDRRASHQDTESLEVRLQEIVLQEMPKLDKGLGTLKLLAAVAPLLGLLGTVVGMISTFQTITLVGNADPKLMAGGISQALMTTVLGLMVAVPLLFSHGFVSSRARLLMIFLSQQSLGYIAQSIESTGNKDLDNKGAAIKNEASQP